MARSRHSRPQPVSGRDSAADYVGRGDELILAQQVAIVKALLTGATICPRADPADMDSTPTGSFPTGGCEVARRPGTLDPSSTLTRDTAPGSLTCSGTACAAVV